MPYCKTSYDTTVGKISSTVKKLEQSLKEALVVGELQNRRLGVEKIDQRVAVFLIGGSTDEANVQPFIHPYLIQNFKGQDYLVTDLRLFRTTSQEWLSDKEFEAGVRNKTEYMLAKSRAVLNLLWLDPMEVNRIRARFNFAASVFAAWLSQAISKAYALDFQEQMRIMAVSMYYYYSLFSTENRLEGDALETAVVHTIKTTKFPATEVYSIFESLGEMKNIEDYCTEVSKVIQNVRLRDFNLAMLLTLIRNSWYGSNAKDLLSVALEHPPTWISIVFTTLTERTYKTSSLYKLIEMQGKHGNADEFRMNYAELMKNTVMALEDINDELVFRDFEE